MTKPDRQITSYINDVIIPSLKNRAIRDGGIPPVTPQSSPDSAIVEHCAKIAEEYDGYLCGYPSEEAQQYYESGIIDASLGIARRIRALKSEDANPDEAATGYPSEEEQQYYGSGIIDASLWIARRIRALCGAEPSQLEGHKNRAIRDREIPL
jgi:hypothetical protein